MIAGYLQEFDDHQEKLLEEFFHLLRFASVSSEKNYESQTLQCCHWLRGFIQEMGFETELWETAGYPTLFAQWLGAGPAAPTLLIYNHYDVQPVDPLELWESPPFEPTVRKGEVYARGAQDNKGQLFFVLAALRATLRRTGRLPINIKLCIEGEEEIGSRGLGAILEAKREALQADHLLVVDVGVKNLESPSVTIGVRGNITMTVEMQGSAVDLHSGIHGGIAYNPNRALTEVLGKLYDSEGRVQVPGFYDHIVMPTEKERADLDLSFDIEWYRALFQAEPVGGERAYSPLESAWFRPTVEINGIAGGYAGDGFKTVIPARAVAKVSARLVPNQNPEQIAERLKQFFLEHTPQGITTTVTVHAGIGDPARSRVDSEITKAALQAMSEVLNHPCRCVLEGASIPIASKLSQVSGAELLLIGLGLPDDQIHAPNEHFGVNRLRYGMAVMCRIFELLSERAS